MDDYFEPAPFFWIEEGKGQVPTPRTRKKTKRKLEYVGWGSKELIGFLHSIGKDTTKALSQYDVTNLINLYVNEKKLVHPNNKRRVLSDDKLYSLFNKKSFFRNKIHELLESHLVENQNGSDDDHFGSSDENDGDAVSKKQKNLSSVKTTQPKKKAPEVLKSCLVAINSENIKLVYLRKSLVQELVSNPETFENKVVGSFVRVKSDPHDIFQKNSHQLQLVTGVVDVVAAGDTRLSKFLQISGMTDDISISELSDDNFSEEEIEDLRTRVKDGLLKQPTIGELEQKVAVLHEDITKHWLAREIKLLKNLIDRANEKGWRPRVAEYLDRRKLLESPAEQSRLLSEIPKVMPEEVKPETVSDNAPDDSPKAADWDWEPCIDSSIKVDMTKPEVLSKQDCQAAEISGRSNGEAHPLSPAERNQPGTYPSAAINNGHAQSVEPKEIVAPKAEAIRVESNGHTESLNANHVDIPSTEISHERNSHLQLPSSKESEKAQLVVILSDDDDDEDQETPGGGGTQIPGSHPKPVGTPGGVIQSPGDGIRVLGGGRQIPGGRIQIPGGGTQIPGGGTQSPGVGTQIPGGGTQIPGSHPKPVGTPGGVIQSPGDGIRVLGGGRQIPGGRIQIPGGGTQIPGGGTQSPGVGTQIPGGGTQIPGIHPGQVVQQYLDPQNRGGNQIIGPHPELLVWHYFDPQNRIQGPFSLMSLKRWNDLRYFPPDFKVWMSGQSPQKAIPLSLVLQHIFPN